MIKKINFFKIHGTGNDFIILNDIENNINNEQFFLKKLCNRHTGIGGDGVILMKKDNECDFYMEYYNSDGKIGTMCGNGSRCAVYLSRILGLSNKNKSKILFKTIDGYHKAFINDNIVSIELSTIKKNKIEINHKYTFLDTGSPHHVIFCKKIMDMNVYEIGKKIRYNDTYLKKGVNVNFVQINNLKKETKILVRTYERGVENETKSCGTGVVASVIASIENNKINNIKNKKIEVNTLGGKLWVSFDVKNEEYQKIYLTGPVKLVFEGWFFI